MSYPSSPQIRSESTTGNNLASKQGLEIIEKIKLAIEYETKHLYINAVGHSGTFSEFIKNSADEALKTYRHSSKWSTIKALMNRYSLIDVNARLHIVKQILSTLNELEDFYSRNSVKKQIIEKNPKLPEVPTCELYQLEIKYVKGVGPQLGMKLNSIGIMTCEDLLHYLPRDHVSYKDKILIANLYPEQEVTIFGQIEKINAFQSQKKKMVILTIFVKDNSGKIKITKYFQGNSSEFYLKQYKSIYPAGTQVLCAGKVKQDKYSSMLVMQNPVIEAISDDFIEGEDNIHTARIVPIYPLTEGLSLVQLRKLIYNTLNLYKNNLKEFVPKDILDRHSLMPYSESVEEIHFPTSMEKKNRAAIRLVFNEFFLMQLHFMLMRHKVKQQSKNIQFNCFENGLVDKFVKALPFKLTYAQERVFYSEILPDMVSQAPMHRLLQGDVGSGKTIVAFLALLVAVSNGFQGAIMVPTEILAEQHYTKFQEWIQGMEESLRIKIGLLTGRQRTKVKRETLQNLANGSTDIVVGTHALIQEGVEFKNLGLIIIDEQHRFGVKQRELLAQKASDLNLHKDHKTAHYVEKLFMTATPIPRTLALAIHGDLDMSEIDEMPPGRIPTITQIVKRKADAYQLIADEVAKGNQVYIVFPLIDESETLSAKAATVEYENLKKETFQEPDFRLGLLHGKLPDEEKDMVINKFRGGEIDILVSTTVIEVGVDVPNATVMFVESAERFGLAQLHQLRGRVGRSDKQSFCLLSSNSKSPNNFIRLQILTTTNNGFIVAQQDLKHRGAGDFIGVKQSGIPDTTFAGLVDHEDILILARNSAKALIEENPDLNGLELLKNKLEKSPYGRIFVSG